MIPLPRISLPPPLARLLPGTSRAFGPPRHCARIEEYAGRAPLEILGAGNPERVPPPVVRTFGPVDSAYLPRAGASIPAPTVFRLRDGAVYGPDVHIVAPDDTFLWDAAWHFARDAAWVARGRSLYRRRRPRPRWRLPGRTAVLGSDWAIGGYGHFLTDALPRWRLVQACGITADDFDHFVLYHPETPAVRHLLQAAGLPTDRLLPYSDSHDLECAELTATTFAGAAPEFSPSSAAWLRRLVPSGMPGGPVYLTRTGFRRHPGNATEIEREFVRRGIRTVRGDDGTAVLSACAGAQVIIGVEGANLFNVAFAPPRARVIVLLPHPGVLPYIPWLCRAAGLAVAVVAAQRGSPPDAPVFPVSLVGAALDWAMAGSTDQSPAS